MAEKIVVIRRALVSGTFILGPMGTFVGYGGWVELFHRALPPQASPEELGELTLELIERSGPTGKRLTEFESDEQSDRLRDRHDLVKGRFLHVEIARRGKTVFTLTKFENAPRGLQIGLKPLPLPSRATAIDIGTALLAALPLPVRPKRKASSAPGRGRKGRSSR